MEKVVKANLDYNFENTSFFHPTEKRKVKKFHELIHV